MTNLVSYGYTLEIGKQNCVSVEKLSCDVPAMSMVKKTKGHTGYCIDVALAPLKGNILKSQITLVSARMIVNPEQMKISEISTLLTEDTYIQNI